MMGSGAGRGCANAIFKPDHNVENQIVAGQHLPGNVNVMIKRLIGPRKTPHFGVEVI